MTSEKQLKANRANALKGGVKTEAGKAIVRLNAVSHGLLTQDVLLPGEDGSLLAELRDRFIAELQPQGELETILVERIISSTWRLRRVIRTETKYSKSSSLALEKGGFIAGADYRYSGWQNFMRYETSMERQIYKAMHELERLQRARTGEKVPVPLIIDLDTLYEKIDQKFCESNPISH